MSIIFSKTNSLLLLGLLLFFSASCERENGGVDSGSDTTSSSGEIIPDGLFSVSVFTKVKFAPGNLKADGHSFTAHQYDFGGLFGWGTGDRPNLTTIDTLDYLIFYDWGNYLAIDRWRTLSVDEWRYLLFQRDEAYSKYGMATVWGIQGLVLLPDKWVLPSGCTFRPGNGWRQNIYDLDQWAEMEKGGAVFLPAAGFRWGTDIFTDKCGYYWSSTKVVRPYPYILEAYCLCFMDTHINVEPERRAKGFSVRLVQDK